MTPHGEPKTDKITPAYEATLGGPFWKDRIWFFGAFRSQRHVFTTSPRLRLESQSTGDRRRGALEGKLTITLFPSTSLRTGTFGSTATKGNDSAVSCCILYSTYDRSLLFELFVRAPHWSSSPTGFLEGHNSRWNLSVRSRRLPYTDLIKGNVDFLQISCWRRQLATLLRSVPSADRRAFRE